MDAAVGRPSRAPIRCTSAETVRFPVSIWVRLEFRVVRFRVGVVQDSVDEVATSSHAAEANAGGTTEQEGNGSPVAAAAAYSPVVAGVDGIRIRRRPVTGPAVHYVGPFQFRLENEGNTPRNILEKIIWNKDVEVSQARLVDENGVMIKPARSTVTLCDFVFWCWHLADEGEEAPVHAEGSA
jgi:indole-3-glycerol phosphate synthase